MDYSQIVDFISLEQARNQGWVRGPLNCDVDMVGLIGTVHLIGRAVDNHFKFTKEDSDNFEKETSNFFKTQGFQVVQGDGLPTTGAAVFCLKKL